MRRPSRVALGAALLTHGLLIAGLLAWTGWPIGLLLALPLAACLPGLLRARTYTAGWASMLMVFYVGALLAEGTAMPLRKTIGQVLAAVAMADFIALVLFVRLASRERAMLAARTESSAAAGR